MELIYLWVEEYKNIHKQGFNFSSRFTCDYDPDTNELTINENNKCIENFFGDNINVTAIVGKNGSGKSSLLEIIHILTNDQEKRVIEKKYLLVFENGVYLTNMNTLKDSNSFLKNKMKYRDIYTFNFVGETSSEIKKLERNIDISKEKILTLLYDLFKFKISIDYPNIFIFNVCYIYINILSSKQLIEKIKKQYIQDAEIQIDFKTFNEFLYNIQQDEDEEWKQFVLNKILNEGIESINNFEYCSLYEWVLQFFYDSDEEALTKDRKKFFIYSNLYDKILLNNITSEQWEFILFYSHILTYEFLDMNGRQYSDLSHGEKTIFSLFLHITRIIDDHIGRPSCLALLDEVDISFHPNWQKSLIWSICSTYSKKSNNIHFVLSTHSPFLLSDTPKQNIIFLDTFSKEDKEVKAGQQQIGNCKVLKHDEVMDEKQTFGANIHTLLSDSFFMEDGLMGEFAKGKINEIIEFHKEVKENKDDENQKDILKNKYERQEDRKPSLKVKFWDVQRIIGEDYLKQVIKNHLIEIEKLLLGKDQAKENEIKRTEAYLESLRNG